MEMREEKDFANSTRSVASSLMGRYAFDYAIGETWLKPEHVDYYLPMIKAGLQEANRRKGDGGSYDAIVLHEAEGNIEQGVSQSTDGIAWTVAFLILTGDEALAQTDPGDLRYLFDASLGIAAKDHQEKYQQASRFGAYQKPLSSGLIESFTAAKNHKKKFEYYEELLLRLREPVSFASAAQRK